MVTRRTITKPLQFLDTLRQIPTALCRLLAMVVLASGAATAAPLSLPQLIERARANDHRVQEARAQLRWLRAKAEEARWAWFPRLDTSVLVAGPTPEARNDGLGGPPTTKATLMYDLDFGVPGIALRAGAEAVLPLYTFGKLAALEAAGQKGVAAGEALTDRARDEAELQVAQAYFGYCLALAGREVIKETGQRLDDARATLDRLRGQGSAQVTQMDVYKLDYFRRQLAVQAAAVASGERYALAAIRLLIGAQPQESVEVGAEPLPSPEGQLAPVDRLVEEARTHRPELRAIEAGLAAREQEIVIRERMYYPDLGLAGFARWAYTSNATRQLSPFAADPYNDLSAGLALVMRYQWDLPQKGILLEQARAELEQLQHQRDLLVAGVRLELDKASAEVEQALIRLEQQTAAERSARRWATSAFSAFELGTGDTRELTDSFSALAQASVARVQALHDVQVGLRLLSRAVGQGVQLQPTAGLAPPDGLSRDRGGGQAPAIQTDRQSP